MSQSTWISDTWEFVQKVFGRWLAKVGAILTIISLAEFVFPNIAQYIPQAIIFGPVILLIGLAAIFFSLVDVYREQKQKSSKPSKLIIKSSSPILSAAGGWHQVSHQGDLEIRAKLDVRNSGISPIIFSIEIAINYDGELFEIPYKKATLVRSNGRTQSVTEKLEIAAEERWSDCSLEIIVPRKFNTVDDFFKAMLTSNNRGLELILNVNAETLEGEKLLHAPIHLNGDVSQILEDATTRWETLLRHCQNLNDEERRILVKALLDSVKAYDQHLRKIQQ